MSKLTKRRLGDWATAVVAALVAVAIAWVAVGAERQSDRVDRQDEQIAALHQALTDEQSNAEAEGIEPVAPPADDLLSNPEYEPLPGPSGPPGPAPSEAALDAALARHFADHPYQGELSAAELAAAFAALLSENPGALNDQIYTALAAYLADNPPPPGPPGTDGQDGTDGAQGDPGPPPTRAEIQAAVEAYMAEQPLPMCPEGTAPEAHEVVVVDGPPRELVGCFVTESTE